MHRERLHRQITPLLQDGLCRQPLILLDALHEQALIVRLAVFCGGFALEAVEAVCQADQLGLDALEALVPAEAGVRVLDAPLVRPAAGSVGPQDLRGRSL